MIYPWHLAQWNKLAETWKAGRLPHAVMLSGNAGVGKSRFAHRFATLVLCERSLDSNNRAAVVEPCGECKSCKLILADAHPDIRSLSPEDKSTVIKVDQVRVLNDYIAKSSQQGAYKIAIIHPAETMTVSAANALLKTLEEPSQKTLIILVVDQPGRMLATIRSRCQVIDFPLPEREQSLSWLRQTITDGGCEDLLVLAAGSPIRAVELAETDAVSQHQSMVEDLAQVLKREVPAVAVAAKWQKYDLHNVLCWNLNWVQALIRYAMDGESAAIRDERQRKMIQYLAGRHTALRFFDLLDHIQSALDLVARNTNPNHTILLENLLVGWGELMSARTH